MKKGEIPTGFDNSPGDEGERILRSYVKGDRIVAYANKYGALGWARIEETAYRLIPEDAEDAKVGYHRHRLKVVWQSHTKRIEDGIRPEEFERSLGIVHPRRTSNRIKDEAGQKLIDLMARRFTR